MPGLLGKVRWTLMGMIMRHYMITKRYSSKFLISITRFQISCSVCSSPLYMEAREKKTKIDWLGSNSTIIHRIKSNDGWANGFSNDFGLVRF